MSRPVRTRYAPSPTGDPHIGNIRSALFSWAFARANGGQFLLRIEDTDQARLVETSLSAIMESLTWLGIDWDEGPDIGGPHAPYFQSQRLPLYRNAAEVLVSKGRAYRCFCTPERLASLRKEQESRKRPPGYDGLCRAISSEDSLARAKTERSVVRFRMKDEGTTVLIDLIRGEVVFENALQDDFVMIKSDGYPTYHLAVVVDDTEMEISHAIRGDEWISSAPKHIQLYEAMGWEAPEWAHLPLILGENHKKLSKRDGDTALLDYKRNGYLPEAMVNFLAFLGWSLDDRTSHITREELMRSFDIRRVVPNPAVFDVDRLGNLNGHYIRVMPPEQWLAVVTLWANEALSTSVPLPLDEDILARAAPLLQERVGRLDEIAPMLEFLFGRLAPAYSKETLTERIGGDTALAARTIVEARAALSILETWDKPAIEAAIRGLETPLASKLRKFVSVLYVATMGKAQGIPLFDSMELLGRECVLERLSRAAEIAEA